MSKTLKNKVTTSKKQPAAVRTNGYDSIDEASQESFPTSDPPAWTLGTDNELASSMMSEAKNISHALAQEYRLIRQLMLHIQQLIKKMEADVLVDVDILNTLGDFLQLFVDKYHREKEEKLLSTLRYSDDHPSEYLMNDLKHEHRHGTNLFITYREASDAYAENPRAANKAVIDALKQIQFFYSNHIAKEEGYILPSIDKLLKSQVQPELVKELDALNKDFDERYRNELFMTANQIIQKIR